MSLIHEYLSPMVEKHPDHIAFIDFDKTEHSFKFFEKGVQEAIQSLKEQGAQAGDRVIVLGENSSIYAAYVIACSFMKCWAIPLNARMTPGEVSKIVEHATPRVLVVTLDASPDADKHVKEFGTHEHTTCLGRVGIATPFESNPEPVSDDGREQVFVMMYTTGTTGTPKGVMLTHENLLSTTSWSVDRRELTPKDKIYSILPISHVAGVTTGFLPTLLSGATCWFVNRFNPADTWDALHSGVSILQGIPQLHAAMVHYGNSQGKAKLESPSLRYVSSGAAPLDLPSKKLYEDFYDLNMRNGYGLTETASGISGSNYEKGSPDISVGAPIPIVEVKIAGANDEGIGEIIARGPNIMKGYYRNPEATSAAFDEEGYFHTGDLGRLDEQGNLHVVGRSKELIIHSGFNVYPPEVEGMINDHPDVLHCAVVGHKTENSNEEVIAYVTLKPGRACSEEEIKGFLKNKLTAYKRPSRIIFADYLPMASSGKILKHKLNDMFYKDGVA
ncbi:class I adenylate-forming enzyme family protein [Flexibacterium corallicola]|uniref:class I adenylate-forming enzyme family protein n=1 Tax=Flexibacterium corallicola TaxID=3037259 RepID=UPI00286F753B|nr:class I adenylate-forming enzyme family protein [Pseudovibrio sp. M1P-2-3]